MGRKRQRQKDIGLLRMMVWKEVQREQEKEIETKIFIHTFAHQPHGFDFVSCPVQLLDRPCPVLMEILGQRRSDR